MPESLRVVDLFSGVGGMSFGFHAHPDFSVVGAADAQIGKPSAVVGALGCNSSYEANIAIAPVPADLAVASPRRLGRQMSLSGDVDVLLACPPCTGFTRTLSKNHLIDDTRNSLVTRVATFAEAFAPQVIVMENARELVMGRFAGHLQRLNRRLARLGYAMHADVYFLNRFGLPQRRERALVVAVRRPLPLRSVDDLWANHRVSEKATHVRRAIWHLPRLAEGGQDADDPIHVAPRFATDLVRRRLEAIPKDGGSWVDLLGQPGGEALMTPAMRTRAARGDFGSHPDVYGRLAWDRPAPTIKRECSHVGNGRYVHPVESRLCSVREMGILQGFPADYKFGGSSISNMYRHIGDAVAPLISFQLAWLTAWIVGGSRPELADVILPNTHLRSADIERLD